MTDSIVTIMNNAIRQAENLKSQIIQKAWNERERTVVAPKLAELETKKNQDVAELNQNLNCAIEELRKANAEAIQKISEKCESEKSAFIAQNKAEVEALAFGEDQKALDDFKEVMTKHQ